MYPGPQGHFDVWKQGTAVTYSPVNFLRTSSPIKLHANRTSFLQEGLHYDLSRVIIKEERSPMQKLARVSPGAISVGRLSDFVKDEVIPGTFNKLGEVQKVETIHNQRYVFEESDMKHGVKKSVRVEILGCDHYTLWSNPECNSLVVDFDNRGNINTVSRIYPLIFTFSSVYIYVCDNTKNRFCNVKSNTFHQ